MLRITSVCQDLGKYEKVTYKLRNMAKNRESITNLITLEKVF